MDSELISVIVPVYNAEKYLKDCLKSILDQSYNNFELIVVNDGSKDRTQNIIDHFSRKDNRVSSIQQDNKGVSGARNTGIRNAKGEWICFVDADDRLSRDALEILYQTAISEKSDAVIGEYSLMGDTPQSVKFFDFDNKISFSKNQMIRLYGACIDSHAFGNVKNVVNVGVPWGKLYKKNIIVNNKISFDERLTNMEDMLFNLDFFVAADRVSYVPVSIYDYRLSQGSLVSRYDPDYIRIADIAVKGLNRFAKSHGLEKKLYKIIEYKKFSLFYECIQKGPANRKDKRGLAEGKKYIKKLANNDYVDGRYRKCISDYMTFPLKICGILTSMRMYGILLIMIKLVLRLRERKGRIR